MEKQQIPLTIDGINEDIYADFFVRLGSILLDFLILAPFYILVLYLNGLNTNAYYFTFIPNLAFHFWYSVYLVKRYGGTPGKLVSGIKILKIDGTDVDWKEAMLRETITLVLTICYMFITLLALSKVNNHQYESLSWREKTDYLRSFTPFLFMVFRWVSVIRNSSELVVLLTNVRRRSLHDFMANTVVVRNKYIGRIREAMNIERS
jgi:uncharacterized RDD family membrane protein YckC